MRAIVNGILTMAQQSPRESPIATLEALPGMKLNRSQRSTFGEAPCCMLRISLINAFVDNGDSIGGFFDRGDLRLGQRTAIPVLANSVFLRAFLTEPKRAAVQ